MSLTSVSQPPTTPALQVAIIDDDEAVRDSLGWLLEAQDYSVSRYRSAEEFLRTWSPAVTGCLVLDIRMPGMTGIELHDLLVSEGHQVPVIFITGHGDVPMAVSRMKKGAVDFLQKPFNQDELRRLVHQALSHAAEIRSSAKQQADQQQRLAKLTQRENQVLERIVAGRLNKQIADDLDISIKTVEAHRANIMEKLGARTMADLMKIALSVNG
jgi:two-component system, LuxR family, response regulator TtrR